VHQNASAHDTRLRLVQAVSELTAHARSTPVGPDDEAARDLVGDIIELIADHRKPSRLHGQVTDTPYEGSPRPHGGISQPLTGLGMPDVHRPGDIRANIAEHEPTASAASGGQISS
jgi:hypothetical protein